MSRDPEDFGRLFLRVGDGQVWGRFPRYEGTVLPYSQEERLFVDKGESDRMTLRCSSGEHFRTVPSFVRNRPRCPRGMRSWSCALPQRKEERLCGDKGERKRKTLRRSSGEHFRTVPSFVRNRPQPVPEPMKKRKIMFWNKENLRDPIFRSLMMGQCKLRSY